MVGPSSFPDQNIFCINSHILGEPFNHDGVLVPGVTFNSLGTMVHPRVDSTTHPLIRDWYNVPTGVDKTAILCGIDPYRRSMSLNWGYLYDRATGNRWLSCGYANMLAQQAAGHTLTPFMYTGGDGTSDSLGSLGPGSANAPEPLGGIVVSGHLKLQVASSPGIVGDNDGWNSAMTAGALAGSISNEYIDFLDQEGDGTYLEGDPYLQRYLEGGVATLSSLGLPGVIAKLATTEPSSQRLIDASMQGSYDGIFDTEIQGPNPSFTGGLENRRHLFDHTHQFKLGGYYDEATSPPTFVPRITVESAYYNYVQSVPSYEDVIAPDHILECFLPNYYMVQTAFQHQVESPSTFTTGDPLDIGYGPQAIPWMEQTTAADASLAGSDMLQLFFEQAHSMPPGVTPGADGQYNTSDDGFAPGLTAQSYWDLWATAVGGTVPGGSPISQTRLDTYEANYKNIVIPHGSLQWINDRNGDQAYTTVGGVPTGEPAIETYPWVNRITINTADNILGPGLGPDVGPTDFFWQLLNNTSQVPATMAGTMSRGQAATWVRMLQLMIANSFNPNLPAPLPWTGNSADYLRNTLHGNQEFYGDTGAPVGNYYTGGHRSHLHVDLNNTGPATLVNHTDAAPWHVVGGQKGQNLKICADFFYLSCYMNSSTGAPNDLSFAMEQVAGAENYSSVYANGDNHQSTTSDEVNFSVLRPMGPGNYNSAASLAALGLEHQDPGSNWDGWNSPLLRLIEDYTLGITDMFKGQLAASSPLMYVIEKRRLHEISPGVYETYVDPATREPVQRIFITRNFDDSISEDIVYYDTQIKYSQPYQYDVYLINIVFGSKYTYTGVSVTAPSYDTAVTTVTTPDVYGYAPSAYGRGLANALGFYREEERYEQHGQPGDFLGDYFDNGTDTHAISPNPNPYAGRVEAQYNFMKLGDPQDLGTIGDHPDTSNPAVYYEDFAAAGQPLLQFHETDIGEDGGFDGSNIGANPSFGGIPFIEQLSWQYSNPGLLEAMIDTPLTDAYKKYGQSGFYVFEPPWMAPGQPGGSVGAENTTLQSTVSSFEWVNKFSEWAINTKTPAAVVDDPFGLPGNGEWDTPVGGLYQENDAMRILRELTVRIANDGMGFDSNYSQGVVPYSVYIPNVPAIGQFEIPREEPENCFVAGTKVAAMVDGHLCGVNIEDIRVGDLVMSYNLLTNTTEFKPVIDMTSPIHSDIVEFEFSNGTTTQHTYDHPYYVDKKDWASYTPQETMDRYDHPDLRDVTQIEVGDQCKLTTGELVTLTNIIEVFNGPIQTYNIMVKDNNNYFADEILVHNKTTAGRPGGPEGDPSCFMAGTKILLPAGLSKNIEDMRIGDYVMSYNLMTKEPEPQQVLNVMSPMHDDIVEFRFANGTTTQHTYDHPYYVVDKGWASYNPAATIRRYKTPDLVNTSLIEPGDRCLHSAGEAVVLTDITEVLTEAVQTYNIIVEQNHNYFADDFLVHNKIAGGDDGPDEEDDDDTGGGGGGGSSDVFLED